MLFLVIVKDKHGGIHHINPHYVRSLKEDGDGTIITFADGGTLAVIEKTNHLIQRLEQSTRNIRLVA